MVKNAVNFTVFRNFCNKGYGVVQLELIYLKSTRFFMFRFLLTYKHILIVFLTITIAVPCTIKKELKQHIGIETNQSPTNTNVKTACHFYSLKQTSKKKSEYHKLDKIPFAYAFILLKGTNVQKSVSTILDFHKLFKEKIPTHIRNQQFLI